MQEKCGEPLRKSEKNSPSTGLVLGVIGLCVHCILHQTAAAMVKLALLLPRKSLEEIQRWPTVSLLRNERSAVKNLNEI
jgi:hypothetical protein